MGYWEVWVAILHMQNIMPGSDLYLGVKHKLTLRENNFNTACRKNSECSYFASENKPHFELPKNWVPRPHKAQCRNRHYGSETYACATQNPVLGILQATKQTNHKTHLVKFLTASFFCCIFLCWKFRHTKYSQIIQVNRSVLPFSHFFQYVKQILWFLMLSGRISSCCIAVLYRLVFMLYVFCTTYYMYLVMLLIIMLFLCCICFVLLCRCINVINTLYFTLSCCYLFGLWICMPAFLYILWENGNL